MTLDVFGRHLTRRRANRIYLIEDVVPDIKRFYEEQLKKELGNLIQSAQDQTKAELNGVMESVKRDLMKAVGEIGNVEVAKKELKELITSVKRDLNECIRKSEMDSILGKAKIELTTIMDDKLKTTEKDVIGLQTDLAKTNAAIEETKTHYDSTITQVGKEMTYYLQGTVSKHELTTAIKGIETKVDFLDKQMTDARIRKICIEEDGKLRCAIFYPFIAKEGKHPTFYRIDGLHPYMEIPIDCKIIFVKANHDVKVRLSALDGGYQRQIPISNLQNTVVSKGTRIYIDLLLNVSIVTGIVVLEYMPWTVFNPPTFE